MKNYIKNLKSGVLSVLPKQLWCILFIIILTLLSTSSTLLAQVNLPSEDRCTSKDLELVEARLSGSNGCIECEDGEKLAPQDLILAIYNKTGSTRTSLLFGEL